MIHSIVSLAFDQLHPLDDLKGFVWDLVLTRPEIAFSTASRARTVRKQTKKNKNKNLQQQKQQQQHSHCLAQAKTFVLYFVK